MNLRPPHGCPLFCHSGLRKAISGEPIQTCHGLTHLPVLFSSVALISIRNIFTSLLTLHPETEPFKMLLVPTVLSVLSSIIIVT